MIPVLYTVVGDKSTYYIGRTLWFSLICLYSLAMNVVQVHWINLREEFKCHGNITYPCFVECFEQLFSIPIIGMWYYFYFIFIALFFLMEYFMAQIRHNYTKVKMETMQQPENSEEVEKGSMEAIRKQSPSQKIALLKFHQEKKLLYLYLLHFLLQVGLQTVLLCLLTFKHLPVISQNNFYCSTNDCPGPYHCLIWEVSEKWLSIYTLSTFSAIIILLGIGSFVYGIYHYLLRARSVSKSWIS